MVDVVDGKGHEQGYWQDGGHVVPPGPLVLLDGASMWFRSFFGVPSSIKAPDGRQVNAVRGFIDAVATVIARESPSRLVVCRDDDWRPQWRVDLIPTYKAHRVEEEAPAGQVDVEEVPDELTPQVDMIMALLDAFGIATAGAPECEADDVLGTLATREASDPVVVVSGDRDLLQLVGDDPVPVRVLYLGQGLAKATKWGPAEVAEKYGVPIDRAGPAYVELALLRGDPSDGLPGVPGVGEKTAATLLAQHGSLEAILAAAHDPKSKMPPAQRRSCWPRPTTSKRPGRWCGWPPMRRSTSRRRRTRFRFRRSTRARWPTSQENSVSRRRSGACRRRSTALPD